MKYTIIFQYDREGSEEYSRDFNIDMVENDIFLEFKSLKKWGNHIENLKSNETIRFNDISYNVSGHETTLEKNSMTSCIYLRHPDDEAFDEFEHRYRGAPKYKAQLAQLAPTMLGKF